MDKKIRKMLEKNFKYLDYGGSRIVLAVNREVVIKVPIKDFGIRQNENEFLVYKNAGYYRRYLCPVIRYSSNILVMARAEPLDYYSEYFILKDFCPTLEFYQDILALSEIFRLRKNDVRATSSWGIFDNKKVLIDYGC